MNSTKVNLWKNYTMATNLILEAMGGVSNIVGEFAEQLVTEFYGGEQLTASSKSADIKLSDGRTVQVKARMPRQTMTTSLGVIRSWDFDVLVAVLFSTDGSVIKAIEMDVETAKGVAIANKHQNGWVITTTREFLEHPKAHDITAGLNNILGIKSEFSQSNRQPNTRHAGAVSPKPEPTRKMSNFDSEPIVYNGVSVDTCKRDNETFQNFVKRTLRFMFLNNMLSQKELELLQTKQYSKDKLGLELPLFQPNTSKLRDAGGTSRYWVREVFGQRYYACSQWWKDKFYIYEPRFAAWIKNIVAQNEREKGREHG